MTSTQFLMQLGSLCFFNTEDTEVAIPRLLVKRPRSPSARENCLISINTVLGLIKPSAFHSLVWLNKDCSYTICVNSIHNTILFVSVS